jgi:hypothetical protein
MPSLRSKNLFETIFGMMGILMKYKETFSELYAVLYL